MTEFRTQDYKKPTLKTSEMPDEGWTLVYRGIRSKETKFAKSMFLVDVLHNGVEKDMLFNSVKLSKIFIENDAVLQGVTFHITPTGSGPQREYLVKIVPGVAQETL